LLTLGPDAGLLHGRHRREQTKPVKHNVVVGTKTVKLAAGHREKVKITLNATGRRLLKRSHKLTVKLTIKLNGRLLVAAPADPARRSLRSRSRRSR
jgi:hypothetical protein